MRKANKVSLKSVITLDRSQWVGVAKLGSIKQTAIGAKVGSRMFEGAFKATMKNGHIGIFRRRYVTSLPIDEIKKNSHAWKTIKEIVDNNAELVFEMCFLQQLRQMK
ncbi:hypothetical protein [Wolbachia endosymbiont (group A) of Lypha dubia]|uniref:hypothetical protein n=1 Tax=Wolbachia endosymbiont (group A) of Lypha dubia TaxID=3066146 RepID=UPI003341FF17